MYLVELSVSCWLRDTDLINYIIFQYIILPGETFLRVFPSTRRFRSCNTVSTRRNFSLANSITAWRFLRLNLHKSSFLSQIQLHCCGVNSWRDWGSYGLNVPQSCCREIQPGQVKINYVDSVAPLDEIVS